MLQTSHKDRSLMEDQCSKQVAHKRQTIKVLMEDQCYRPLIKTDH